MSIKVTDDCGTEVTATFRSTGDDGNAPDWGTWISSGPGTCSGGSGYYTGYYIANAGGNVLKFAVGWRDGNACYNPPATDCGGCWPTWEFYLSDGVYYSGDDYGEFSCVYADPSCPSRYKTFRTGDIASYPDWIQYSIWGCT